MTIHRRCTILTKAAVKHRRIELVIVYLAIPGFLESRTVGLCGQHGLFDPIHYGEGKKVCQVFPGASMNTDLALVCIFLGRLRELRIPCERRHAVQSSPFVVGVEHVSPLRRWWWRPFPQRLLRRG